MLLSLWLFSDYNAGSGASATREIALLKKKDGLGDATPRCILPSSFASTVVQIDYKLQHLVVVFLSNSLIVLLIY